MKTENVETIAPEVEPLWDAKEAAHFLNVSRTWIYERSEAGLLPHLRIGSLLRFEPATLKAFARQDRVSASYVITRLKNAR